ncbi:hypothetical protein FRC04_004869 [Tulasnella sp. 424]|nr:hypothetical protein FRC04_004869 [Tulasnella sp. 424]KAG8963548.1 hypothetical protein FRC05_004613 [Tulasnella sp. 425]
MGEEQDKEEKGAEAEVPTQISRTSRPASGPWGIMGEDCEEQGKLDVKEKAAIDELQLHKWELVDVENRGFDISMEPLNAVCQMVVHIPPWHWHGYLWCIFEDKASAKTMLEKLRQVISQAKGYTTGPKTW